MLIWFASGADSENSEAKIIPRPKSYPRPTCKANGVFASHEFSDYDYYTCVYNTRLNRWSLQLRKCSAPLHFPKAKMYFDKEAKRCTIKTATTEQPLSDGVGNCKS